MSGTRRETRGTAGRQLPLLEEPAHLGAVFVRHIGLAVALLLASVAATTLAIGERVQVTLTVRAEGVLETGPERCPGLEAWCAQLFVEGSVRDRLFTGMPVRLRLVPRGALLRGRVTAITPEQRESPGQGTASLYRVAVRPDDSAPEAPDGEGFTRVAGPRPVSAELVAGQEAAHGHLGGLLADWLHLRGR